MLTTFKNTNHLEIMRQALMISSFYHVRDTFLGSLSVSTDFTNEQKLAIRLAGAKLNFMGTTPEGVDQLLIDILFMTWQDVGLGADDVLALSDEQREGIIEGLMNVCRDIIAEEANRLLNLSIQDTQLPDGWNYTYAYGYGYESEDYFNLFGGY